MLGRTANDLFWMSRYIERAENIARLLEVGYRIALLPREGAGQDDEWRSTLRSAGCDQGYLAKHGAYATRNVVNYMLFDVDNPSSVYSSLSTARHNARAQRTALTREMWECLNSAWIVYSAIDANKLVSNELPPLFDWIKERSALFRGALLNTILRNDTFYFNQLGTFLERADNTARILDVKYYVLLPHNELVGGEIDSAQWAAILRSVSAHRSYRWVYRESYKPWRVADYLILNRQMPRSLGPATRRSPPRWSSSAASTARAMAASRWPRDPAAARGRRHERHLPIGPARVPGGVHRPQQPPGLGDLGHLPLHRLSPPHDADLRSSRHTLSIRAARHLQHPGLAADARVLRRPARVRLGGAGRRRGADPAVQGRVRQYRASVTLNVRHEELEIEAAGTVETQDSNGVVAGLANGAPPRVFLRETVQTRPDGAIHALAKSVHGKDTLATLHELLGAVRDRVEYVAGATDTHTGAAEALADGKGVCQDHAHIFIAAARTLAIPARYVTGYLMLDGQSTASAHHAWAEAWVEGLGWVGFDVANRVCPTHNYVRLAAGLDASYAAPIVGSRRGGETETLEVSVAVQQQQQTAQQYVGYAPSPVAPPASKARLRAGGASSTRRKEGEGEQGAFVSLPRATFLSSTDRGSRGIDSW